MAKSLLVTLLTDFGTQDPYVAAMKGTILSICPRAQIVDLCHGVPAHDILAGAFILTECAPTFPADTLHVVVVDPGVGTRRRILFGQFGAQQYLFPDNGIITLIAQRYPLRAMVTVRNVDFVPPEDVSATFHGRDLFAPVAAHLLRGLDFHQLGPQPQSYKLIEIPQSQMHGEALLGQVIYIDRFGNLVTNIPADMVHAQWPSLDRLRVSCTGRDIGAVQGTYGFAKEGELVALFNSMGLLEVAVNQGRACDELGARLGTEVRVVGPAAG
ncbi:MAG TPA: SAM-dependent chlorinase/fluorinase [Phycisphaerae bacterium]|nr:SAM-dependent chlorinase/fluorinase [Phycisphaerae bacterium]